MKIVSVLNPVYSAIDNSSIDCLVEFDFGVGVDENGDPIVDIKTYQFTVTANDPEPHGQELWTRLNAGEFGAIAPFPTPTQAQLLTALAAYRYTVQTGGLTISGVPVSTDEVSLAKLSDAWIKAKFDNTLTISWVANGNVYPLNAAQIIAIGDAVFTFQQKCYATQANLLQNISNYNTIANIKTAFDNGMKA